MICHSPELILTLIDQGNQGFASAFRPMYEYGSYSLRFFDKSHWGRCKDITTISELGAHAGLR